MDSVLGRLGFWHVASAAHATFPRAHLPPQDGDACVLSALGISIPDVEFFVSQRRMVRFQRTSSWWGRSAGGVVTDAWRRQRRASRRFVVEMG